MISAQANDRYADAVLVLRRLAVSGQSWILGLFLSFLGLFLLLMGAYWPPENISSLCRNGVLWLGM